MKSSNLLLLIAALAVVSCSTGETTDLPDHLSELENLKVYPVDAKPASGVQFQREQTFGDTEAIFFRRISRFTVDESGKVYIAQDSVLVFNPNGTYATSIGGEGAGPGEFETIGNIKAGKGSLYIFDAMLRRITAFSLDSHSLLYTIPVPQPDGIGAFTRGEFHIMDNHRLLISLMDPWKRGVELQEMYFHYFYLDSTGVMSPESILKLRGKDVFTYDSEDRYAQGILPFSGHTMVAVSDEGNIFTAWSEEVFVKRHKQNGRYEAGFYYPYRNISFNQNEYLKSMPARNREVLEVVEFPETWPALDKMLIDDENRLWLSLVTVEGDADEWWIVTDEGEWLAKFKWPVDNEIVGVRGGKIYSLEKDEENGADQVVRYRFRILS